MTSPSFISSLYRFAIGGDQVETFLERTLEEKEKKDNWPLSRQGGLHN
jgi:hypothetical protein